MTTCFFSIISDLFYYNGGGYKFVNSFRRFHPDIDLIVFRQDAMDKHLDINLMPKAKSHNEDHTKASYSTAKPFMAKLLMDKYDRVINIDADHVITGRLDAILEEDWEIGGVTNLNDYENASFENITPEMYVQCGLIGSTRKEFWNRWDEDNKYAYSYRRYENDILNKVIYNDPVINKLKLKIFDKDRDYYGVKSLNRESEMYIENNELMLRGEKVKAYHQAKGSVLPKLHYEKLGFTNEVVQWLYKISLMGRSFKINTINI